MAGDDPGRPHLRRPAGKVRIDVDDVVRGIDEHEVERSVGDARQSLEARHAEPMPGEPRQGRARALITRLVAPIAAAAVPRIDQREP
jgi:hypothetical protein